MNKEKFIREVNNKLENITLTEAKEIITNIIEKIPKDLYEKVICIIDNIKGDLDISNINGQEIDEIINKIELINKGELSFKSYSYATGEYYYYEEEYEDVYSDPNDINQILTSAYNLGVTLVNKKEYELALKLFDAIIHANYQCDEMGNPDYDDSEEVYDTYDIDLIAVSDLLSFNLNNLYSYAIYATYFINNENKYYKIYSYLKECPKIKFEDSYNLGIEKMNNISDFYINFANYLTTISGKNAMDILEDIIILGYIDEYEICKKSFHTHPKLYLKYIKKLFQNKKYTKIIETISTYLDKIKEPTIKNELCYIMVDSIKLSNQNIDINKYLYEAFISINDIPNFLVILYHNLYDEKIKKIVNLLEYKNDECNLLSQKEYIEDKSLFDLFLANFEIIYQKYNNKNEELTYLIMLYLNNNLLNKTKIKNIIINRLTARFSNYHYKNLDINLNNKEYELLTLFNKWKNTTNIDNDLKIKFINKLKNDIESEANYILKNKIRTAYKKIAIKIVLLDEVLSSNNIINKGKCIAEYENKYIRYNAFRKEIKELLN